MSVIFRSRTITVMVVAAAGLVACEAFAPQTTLRVADATSRSQDSLVSRNAFFSSLFRTEEKSTETSAEESTNGGVMDVLSSFNSKNLIEKTKDFVDNKGGFYSPADPDMFAEDFVFRGPYMGPLNKKDYLGTMEALGMHKSFPDVKANSWGYSIDPQDPNRVWFLCRNTGTFSGEPLLPDLVNIQPNNGKLEGPPETFSVVYDENQKIKYLTVGYVADRFDGNTGGDAAAVGVLKTVGFPFPSPGPLLWAVQFFNSEVLEDFYPKSYSTDVPEWFLKEKGTGKGVDGYK